MNNRGHMDVSRLDWRQDAPMAIDFEKIGIDKDSETARLLIETGAGRELTREEILEQRVSYIYGTISQANRDSTSKEEIRKKLEKY